MNKLANNQTNKQPTIPATPFKLPIGTNKEDGLHITQTANNVNFLCQKTRIQASINVGQDSEIAALFDHTVAVEIDMRRDKEGGKVSVTGQLPLAMLLAFASNGIFEVCNTNTANAEDKEQAFRDQWEAMQAGYIYKGVYATAMRSGDTGVKDFRAFLTNVVAGTVILDVAQTETIQRNVIAKGLKLGKGVAPTPEQITEALADAKRINFGVTQLAKLEVQLFKLWPWLEAAVTDSGYARTELQADDLL